MGLTVSLNDCRHRGGSAVTAVPAVPAVPAASAVPATGAPYLLIPSELIAYRRGREREIALLRAAVARRARNAGPMTDSSVTAEALSRDGAAAAGLSVADYAVVVSRVDSALRLRASSGTATSPGSAEWAVLDSLRVELTVLRSRLEALGEGAP